MSEFMERHTTARLVGSPPGYVGYDEGGQLTEAVRRRPYSVILFDEIEKAHPEVFNMLLQILEDGRLSDAKGKVVNFANTVIIMTSNLGIRDVNQAGTSLGFQPAVVDEADEVERRHKNTKEKIDEELKRMFRPEFLNRVDAVVVFKSLTTGQIRQIVDLQLNKLSKHLVEQQITIEVTDAAKDLLAKEGYDRVYGARPLAARHHEQDRGPAVRAPAAWKDRARRHGADRRRWRGRAEVHAGEAPPQGARSHGRQALARKAYAP